MNYQIEDKAYKKLMLHLLKYHKSDCIGLLIGKKTENPGKRTVVIEDAVPLFHTRVMSGTLEIAFDMIESTLPSDTKIVGLYEAPISFSDSIPTPLAVAVASQIKGSSHFNEPCIISVKAVS